MSNRHSLLRDRVRSVALVLVATLVVAGIIYYNSGPDAEKVAEICNATIIPKFPLRRWKSYSDALSVVLEEVRRQHPESRKIRVVSYAGTPVYPIDENIELRDVPATDAIKYICSLSNVAFAFRDGAIFVYRGWDDDQVPPFTIREKMVAKEKEFAYRIRRILRH